MVVVSCALGQGSPLLCLVGVCASNILRIAIDHDDKMPTLARGAPKSDGVLVVVDDCALDIVYERFSVIDALICACLFNFLVSCRL